MESKLELMHIISKLKVRCGISLDLVRKLRLLHQTTERTGWVFGLLEHS